MIGVRSNWGARHTVGSLATIRVAEFSGRPLVFGPLARASLVALSLTGALLVAAPLGRLRDPLVLVLVLPPLAASLEALGWSRLAARQIRRITDPLVRVVAAYGLWLATSALLTLDVAAVAAASVGLAVGGARRAERDAQLGAAIVGSNVGSLLFPFSNLTNLVLLAGAGIGFGAYVDAALVPQIATAATVGVVLAWRSRRRLAEPERPDQSDRSPTAAEDELRSIDPPARLAGAIVLAGSVAAVAVGFAGGDIAAVFVLTAALVAGLAAGAGRATPRRLLRSVPLLGVAVIVLAVVLGGPMAALATRLPAPARLGTAPLDFALVALVGGLLAAGFNNLPAAAFGAVWLHGASPALVVAYLIGTNVLALVTPHGSLATVLCRSVAERAGHAVPHGPYLRAAWWFGLAGSVSRPRRARPRPLTKHGSGATTEMVLVLPGPADPEPHERDLASRACLPEVRDESASLRSADGVGVDGGQPRPGGAPAGQLAQPFVRRRTRFGRVGHERQARVGGQLQRLVGEGQIADERVVEALGARAVEADVVACPEDPELRAAGGQLPDEVRQRPVIRVPARLTTQRRHDVMGDRVPIDVEAPGPRVEKEEPRRVWRPDGVRELLRVEGLGQRVRVQDVEPAIVDEGRERDDRVDDPPDAGADALRPGSPARHPLDVRDPDEIEQMGPLGLVELQRPADGVKDLVRDPARVAAFEPRVVLDADVGKEGDLLAAQAGHPPFATVHRQAGSLGRDPGPPRGEKLADLGGVAHP